MMGYCNNNSCHPRPNGNEDVSELGLSTISSWQAPEPAIHRFALRWAAGSKAGRDDVGLKRFVLAGITVLLCE